jgi:glycosyltransferase involved in cell wall biosynthesis
VVVVNGPSTDGTTGMVREREDVDVLVEIADRTVNPARNAGIDHASGDVIALVDHGLVVTHTWLDAVREGIQGSDVVTGPVHEQLRAGVTAEAVESQRIAGRDVTHFNGGNVAFRRAALDTLDGFDEYLDIGGARDCAHRLAALDFSVEWHPGMAVTREIETDGGVRETDWGWKYRSFAYRIVKNYGLSPRALGRLGIGAVRDGASSLREVLGGEDTPSHWVGNGRAVLTNVLRGAKDGLWARTLDRTPRRNPRGRSTRSDRAVAVYDCR